MVAHTCNQFDILRAIYVDMLYLSIPELIVSYVGYKVEQLRQQPLSIAAILRCIDNPNSSTLPVL